MTYIGDFLASGSADYIFTTIDAGGTPSALSGGSVVVYKNNGTVESSSGVTLTASFDGRTGMNHVGINLAADGSFYAAGANFNVALAVGTVSSVSIAGYRLCSFSVENRNQKPTGGTVANVSGSVTGGVLSAGTITNPILVRGGTIATVTGTVTYVATTNIVNFLDGFTSPGDLALRGAVDTALGAYSSGAGVMPIGGAAGTITNPILVRGGTVALATAAGTINNPVLVYGGTVALATAAGTVNNPVLVYGGTVAVATSTGTVTSPITVYSGTVTSVPATVATLANQAAILALLPDDIAEATFKKNTAFNNFQFVMFDTDDTPVTGKTLTATRSIDGAAFGACANSVTEVSNGFYKINLAAADLNGDTIALLFTATGCNDRQFLITPGS